MKILEIILHNHLGGISQRAITVADGMAERGLVTHFLLPKESGDVHEVARDKNFFVHQIYMPRPNPRKPLNSILWMVMLPINTLQIRSIIRRYAIDAIHVNGLINIPGFIASKLCNIPLIWHLAATSLYPKWVVRLFRPMLKKASVIVCIAEAVRDYFLGCSLSEYNWRVVHEPVDIENFSNLGSGSFRKEFGFSLDTFIIVTVANITPWKGILCAIQAMNQLSQKHKNVHYVIVGEILETQKYYYTKLRKEVEIRKLQDYVTFAGKRSDICNILNEADVFLLPSLSEGTPISILEAMAMRVPVVATNVGGIPEQINQNVSGQLVKPNAPEEITIAIDRLISEPGLAKEHIDNAYEKVCKEFSLSRFLVEYDRIIRKYVKDQR
ncbi:MAG: glycosyltransferase family 4 protein [Desulfobacteraceae bacterium]|nr:glycosyltransferase family 4 protein [Desulfobacteraceae bacterium]